MKEESGSEIPWSTNLEVEATVSVGRQSRSFIRRPVEPKGIH